jgi:hypothetical protein
MSCVLRISVFFCATLGADAMQLAFAADCASLCHTLCNGISSIANSTPEQLRQPGAIAAIVRRVGLYSPIEGGHETFKEKYGEEYAKSVIKRGATRNGMASSPDQLHGMWQSPEQFECAMLHLSTLPIHSTLSIGTYSGWTDVLLHTVLRRFRPEQHLSSIITDQADTFTSASQTSSTRWAQSAFKGTRAQLGLVATRLERWVQSTAALYSSVKVNTICASSMQRTATETRRKMSRRHWPCAAT